jgi:predicted metalloprotease
MGPFYCPADREVYLDTSFFQELRDRFRAPGEFAEAYVIAHEIGHHVKNLLGISEKAEAAQSRSGKTQANAISVRVELQADCLAGVWAINTQRREQARGNGFLETGDVEQALGAASMIGDDKLQSGHVVTWSDFTWHLRTVRWFRQALTAEPWQAATPFDRSRWNAHGH